MEHCYIPSPWGSLYISGSDEGIHSLLFADPKTEYLTPTSPTLRLAIKQIAEYLHGMRTEFTVPLVLKASGFSKQVLEALLQVPYGQLVSYKELAILSGNPRAARAVGNVMNKNPICLLIPCHRVIASGGKIGGFGYNIHIKKDLLLLEGHSRYSQE